VRLRPMRCAALQLLLLLLIQHVSFDSIPAAAALGTEQPCNEAAIPRQRAKALGQTQAELAAEDCAASCRCEAHDGFIMQLARDLITCVRDR